MVVSEAVSHGDTTNGDWIELHNTSGSQVDLTDAILSDNNDTHGVRINTDLTGTAEPILLGGGQYAAFRVDDLDVPGNFGLGDADQARLFTADTVDLTTQPAVDESDAWSGTPAPARASTATATGSRPGRLPSARPTTSSPPPSRTSPGS